MPACASESYSSGDRFRSSSPPNSRSNSVSPPLPWSMTPTVSPISGSPGHPSSIGAFKRSMSNISNSSLIHGNSASSDHSLPTSSPGSDSGRATSPPVFVCHNRNFENFIDQRERSSSDGYQHWTNVTAMKRVSMTKQNQVGGCSGVNEEKRRGIVASLFLPARIFAWWYINIALRIVRRSYDTLNYIIWAPILWISAWICVFWVILQLPLVLIKWFIRALYTPAFERARSKRCVLISGGSTLQALHLARNFYKAGARVVVCEIDGLFGLARFSTACSRFYSVPRPGPGTAAEYVDALKKIVEREKAVYFIPVSCTSGAYYDALAKPHLEIIGCECFVPSAAEVTSLEDPLQLLQRCNSLGLSTPIHFVLKSLENLMSLYETGCITANERHVMLAAGPAGMRERTKLHLPSSTSDGSPPRNLRRKLEQHEVSERSPWIVIREPASGTDNGHQFVTCTTIKNSRVVANVTCRIDESRGLIPENRLDVDQWLEAFFGRPFATKFNGHLSFKLAASDEDGQGLVFISCRVGVPLPYLCLTSVHPRLVWRPCRHFSRQNSANLLLHQRYKQPLTSNLSSGSLNGLYDKNRTISSDNNSRIFSAVTILDKRDALFVYWDPLPYCAYYHLQLPFRRLAGVIREQPAQHKPPLAVVQ